MTDARPSQIRSALLTLSKVILAVVLIWFLSSTRRLHFAKLSELTAPSVFLVVVPTVFMACFVPAIRWWTLLKCYGQPMQFASVLGLTWFGYAAGLFLPGAAAGDAVKAVAAVTETRRGLVAYTVFLDRFIGLYGVLLISVFAVLSVENPSPPVRQLRFTLVVATVVSTGLLAALCSRSISAAINRIVPNRLRRFVPQPPRQGLSPIVMSVFLSVVSTGFATIALVTAGVAAGMKTDATRALVAAPLVFVVNCLPVTPGGIGIGETAADALFRMVGCDNGAEAMLGFRVVNGLVSSPGLLWLAVRRNNSAAAKPVIAD